MPIAHVSQPALPGEILHRSIILLHFTFPGKFDFDQVFVRKGRVGRESHRSANAALLREFYRRNFRRAVKRL